MKKIVKSLSKFQLSLISNMKANTRFQYYALPRRCGKTNTIVNLLFDDALKQKNILVITRNSSSRDLLAKQIDAIRQKLWGFKQVCQTSISSMAFLEDVLRGRSYDTIIFDDCDFYNSDIDLLLASMHCDKVIVIETPPFMEF